MGGMLSRALEPKVREALSTFPVVAITGARQVGKSTLANVVRQGEKRYYVTLDDLGSLESAQKDPHGFIDGLPKPATIDEVQRAPSVLIAIKKLVDKTKKVGDFLITGSARLEATKGVRETLAGRVALMQLNPMTILEIDKRADKNPIDDIFGCDTARDLIHLFNNGRKRKQKLEDSIMTGGFPTVAIELSPNRRSLWFEQYYKTYIERDVPFLLSIQELPVFLRYITAVTATTGRLVNLLDIARDVGISPDTAKRWLGILELTFLVQRVQPFWANIRKRLAKSPKIFMLDSGLAANILGIDDWGQAMRINLAGQLLETWFYQQIASLCQTCSQRTNIFFYRTYIGQEVDFILSRKDELVAIEVKATKTLSQKDWTGVAEFVKITKGKAKLGIVLYLGEDAVPIADKVVGLPFNKFFYR